MKISLKCYGGKMEEYINCYIAFIDILGFKRLIKEKKCHEILELFKKVKKIYGLVEYDETGNILKEYPYKKLQYKLISDSICIYIDSNIEDSLQALIVAVGSIQANLLFSSEHILCRGAISRGNIYINDDIIFGQGFVDAYLMEENNAKFPRIILCNDLINSASLSEDSRNLINMFTYCDFDMYTTINSMLFCREKNLESYNKLLDNIYSVLNKNIEYNVREKYVYLRNIVESMRNKFVEDIKK